MRIVRRLEEDGTFLFRWRSFLPLTLLIIALPAVAQKASDGMESHWGHIFSFVCMGIAVFGELIRCATVGVVRDGTSGRNTRSQRADELNTTGLYSLTRNPLYLGNFIAMLGVMMALRVWWLPVVYSLVYWLYIERIIATEERYLTEKFGALYEDWVARTPAFFPKLHGWKKPEYAFSLKTVLRREYNGFFSIGLAFLLIEFITDVLLNHEPTRVWLREDYAWLVLFGVCTTLFLVLRTMKKHTTLLSRTED